MNKRSRVWAIWLLALTIFLVIVSFISLSSGSVNISKRDIFNLFYRKVHGDCLVGPESTIIFNMRIPRIILGFLVGGALSLAGAIFQGMFRNPLVEPYTLGISGGAALMVSLTLLLGYSMHLGLPLAGFLGALLSIFLVYTISNKWRTLKTTGLLLVGVMFSFICSSVIMLIMSVAKTEEAHGIIFWIMGSLEESDPLLLKLVAAGISIGAILSFFKAWDLNAISIGDEEAIHLGINLEKSKKILFILASFLTGIAVSVSGIIGFVGLIMPHLMRILVGTDHRILMPASFLSGGIFLILCDTVARTIISPIELPVGVLTGIIGGTIFLYFLFAKTA